MEVTECIVCMEEITGQTGHTALGCGHKFHLVCIVRWFAAQPEDSTCPYCRHTVGEKDNLPMAEDGSETESDSSDSDSDSSSDDDSSTDYSEDELEPGMRRRFAHLLDDPNAHIYVDYDEELLDWTSWDASGNLHSHWSRDVTTGVWNRTMQPLLLGKWNPNERPAEPITLHYHVREIQRAWRGYQQRQQYATLLAAKSLLSLTN
jgi:hypothetical protein